MLLLPTAITNPLGRPPTRGTCAGAKKKVFHPPPAYRRPQIACDIQTNRDARNMRQVGWVTWRSTSGVLRKGRAGAPLDGRGPARSNGIFYTNGARISDGEMR
jgi:hypothetical protein